MNVLVTGAGGNLGRALLPELARRHGVRAADARELDLDVPFVRLDVREREAVAQAVDGIDAVVHAAALHGVHLDSWSPWDYWSTNVTGTFNVYECARLAGVRRVVLCSTMGVYGDTAARADEAWAVVTEELPTEPNDVYGLSKSLCEEIGRYYARTAGITTWALRLGMFVPETFERYGFRLLFGGVDDRDVAQAVLLALERHAPDGFDYANVMAETPFAPDDARELAVDPARVIERYWPGTNDTLAERGLEVGDLVWGWAIWPIEKARRKLGYRPRYGFGEFLDALRRGDDAHYPFAGLPQWGVR